MTAITNQIKLYSFEEYCNYDDGTDARYDLVNGELEIVNPPTYRHLLISDFIRDIFKAEIARLKLPLLCFKEAGIRTGWRKSRLADLYVIEKSQIEELLDRSAIAEIPPLLVVEVVSPDSVSRDYRFKRSEYAALGIPEYWIVDPKANKIMVLLLKEGLYEETVFTGEDKIMSRQFSELYLTVNQVLAAANL